MFCARAVAAGNEAAKQAARTTGATASHGDRGTVGPWVVGRGAIGNPYYLLPPPIGNPYYFLRLIAAHPGVYCR
jgi:hypothetical protein